MRKMLGSLAALSALVLTGLVAGPAAAVTVPTGYDDGTIAVDIVLPDAILYGGDTVAVKVAATRDGQPLVCTSLTVSATPNLVQTFTGGGQSTYDLELSTEVVRERTPTAVTAVCNFTPLQSQSSDQSGVASATTASYSAASTMCGTGCVTNSSTITLLPRDGAGSDSSGILPKTGAEIGLWLLVAGGVLVVGGGTVLALRRRAQN